MHSFGTIGSIALTSLLLANDARAQVLGCAGASGVTPTLEVKGNIRAGQTWSLDITAPGGLGIGYLLVGIPGQPHTTFPGQLPPFDLEAYFGDPLWSGCRLYFDPNFAVVPYTFDPNANGGLKTFNFPGWDHGTLYLQVINLDPDFVTRIAGVSYLAGATGMAPPEVVAIPPGTFEMGSAAPNAAPYFNDAAQQPVHTVTISYPFWMGKYEVRQDEFFALGGLTAGVGVGYFPNLPLIEVRWEEALDFCTALTAQEALLGNVPPGYEYRLPTEAEWEYACRAGTTTEFNTGAALDCTDAKFTVAQHTGASCGATFPAFVGAYAPNAFGLHDMHGNAAEWCLDAYQPYVAGAVTDPFVAAPLGASSVERVLRGGSFAQDSSACRSASRRGFPQARANFTSGFRIVLGPILVP